MPGERPLHRLLQLVGALPDHPGRGGDHGGGRRDVTRGELFGGRIAKPLRRHERVARTDDRHLDVEEVAVLEARLFRDGDGFVGVGEAHRALGGTLDGEERVGDLAGQVGVSGEFNRQRLARRTRRLANELERLLLVVGVLQEDERGDHGSLVGEGRPEDRVRDGRLLLGFSGDRGGQILALGRGVDCAADGGGFEAAPVEAGAVAATGGAGLGAGLGGLGMKNSHAARTASERAAASNNLFSISI